MTCEFECKLHVVQYHQNIRYYGLLVHANLKYLIFYVYV